MSVQSNQVPVPTSGAAVIVPALPGAQAIRQVTVTNVGPTNFVWLGGPGVTSSTGWKLAVNTTVQLTLGGDALYGLADTAAVTVTYLASA